MTKAQEEKQELYLNRLLVNGIVDNRKIAVVANAKKMPNGDFGNAKAFLEAVQSELV